MRRILPGVMMACSVLPSASLAQGSGKHAPKLITVPAEPGATDQPQVFKDPHFDVTFSVPPGWEVSRKDGRVSTFHMDARSAPATAELRGVAILDFNPFPQSTLSGALFYFSVEKKTSDVECARQASGEDGPKKDVQQIGGMPFTHGHDEHGGICTEARDEIYTAYRKHSCYRFDLAMNTFCSISSGAREITDDQVRAIEKRMTDILSTVSLGWEKSGPNEVPVPPAAAAPAAAPVRPGQS